MPDVPGTVNYPSALDSAVSLFEAANNATAVLMADGGGATLTVNDTSLFPSSGALSIGGEIIYYASKTADTFTGCLRGREGTIASAHPARATVELRITARQHSVLADAIIALETKLGSNTSPLGLTAVTGKAINDEAGDSLAYNTNRAPLRWGLALGTAASPITAAGAPLKISKTESILDGVLTNGAASDENAALSVFAKGLSGTQVQVAAIHAFATSASTQSGFNDDSTALLGVGRVEGTGATGLGVGGYFEGYVGPGTAASAGAIGTELRSSNFTGSDHAYNPAGASKSMALWLTPNGDAANRKSGAAIGIGKLPNGLWDVGIGAVAGSIANTFLRDDSSALTSILINGAHSTAALAIASGSGAAIIGATSLANASCLLEVRAPDAAADPLVFFGNASFARPYSVRLGASTGTSVWFIANTANQFLTGTAQGDVGLLIATSGKKLHFGGTASVLAITQSNLFGAFGVTPVARQSVGAAAIDAATTQTLANNLRTALINLGWAQT